MTLARFGVSTLVALTLGLTPTTAADAQSRLRDHLGWLAGCWELRSGTRLVEEQWLPPRAGTMIGVGRTTRGDTLIEYEFVRIYERGDTLVYAASPSGQQPAEFRATSLAQDGEVVFANPAHDFPQRVRYRRLGADSAVARIEGTRNGKTRGVDFPYKRVPCERGT